MAIQQWDSATNYTDGEFVVRSGVVYLALTRTFGKDPSTSTSYWLAQHEARQVVTPEEPAEGSYTSEIGVPSSRIYLYKSDSNTAAPFELTLVGGVEAIGAHSSGPAFPPYPHISFWAGPGAAEKIKLSESALKITKIEFVPTEPIIKPVVITFETHAVVPLKKGEVLLIRVDG